MNVYDDPTLLSCNHTFCRKCICYWAQESYRKECPLCKRNFSSALLAKDSRMANIVNSLAVRCSNVECKWEGNVLTLKRHLKKCQLGQKKQKKRKVLVHISDDDNHNGEIEELDEREFKKWKPQHKYTATYYLGSGHQQNN